MRSAAKGWGNRECGEQQQSLTGSKRKHANLDRGKFSFSSTYKQFGKIAIETAPAELFFTPPVTVTTKTVLFYPDGNRSRLPGLPKSHQGNVPPR